MGATAFLRRVEAGLLVAVGVPAVVSCTDADRPIDGAVVFEVVLEAGQRWTAEGPAVDSGAMCSRGTRHVVRGIDPATAETVPVWVWSETLDQAITRRNSTEITFVVEHTCTDGSGSFVILERWGPDGWSILSGTGAYRDLAGAGDLSFTTVAYLPVSPLRLTLDGVLERSA